MKYFDFAATTPVDKRVFEAMKPYYEEDFFNASGLYTGGKKTSAAVADAREKVMNALNVKEGRLIFTSGGTEADNLAIIGTAFRSVSSRKVIAISAIEHHAILESAESLKKYGFEIRILPVDCKGKIVLEKYKELVNEDVLLVSVMTANNEIGIIQDIKELCAYAHEKGAIFHTDAVQAFPCLEPEPENSVVDMISVSSHKIYGPKGCGALWLRDESLVTALMHGGQQEDGYRGGTENVPAIVGFGKACELLVSERKERTESCERKRRRLLDILLKEEGENILVNTDLDHSVPGILNVAFKDAEAEGMLFFLSREGFSLSMGSACNSKSVEPSHVVRAINVPEEYARGCVRASFGNGNTDEDIDALGEALIRIYRKMKV